MKNKTEEKKKAAWNKTVDIEEEEEAGRRRRRRRRRNRRQDEDEDERVHSACPISPELNVLYNIGLYICSREATD